MRGPPGSWAHPRSRGENSIVVGAARAAAGSSPLTRGKQGQQARAHPDRRLIPAHAGKTRRAAYATRRSAAHPRSRGENRVLYGSLSEVQGSSPLTRGKHDVRDRRLPGRGLIPAHAGKTSRGWRGRPSERAHPRSRGENSDDRTDANRRPGSSPLTRGKPSASVVPSTRVGLIPAHAGKTKQQPTHAPTTQAHPRSRGENPVQQGALGLAAGSSPLTRGKLPRPAEGTDRERLIPAHAGKTGTSP